MTSPLETIPSEVLERIAIYAASSSIFDWPVEVSYLMQSRALHSALSIRSAPHVYAEIFASKFDISAPNRRYRHTSSFRAAELVNRYRLLKRCKRRDVSPTDLMQDLLTALWMFLESDGLNERQLRNVDFPNFMLQVARAQLKGVTAPIDPEAQRDGQASSLGHIIVWLLCFSLRRGETLVFVAFDDNNVRFVARRNLEDVPNCSGRIVWFDLSIYILFKPRCESHQIHGVTVHLDLIAAFVLL